MEFETARDKVASLIRNIEGVVLGKGETVRLAVTALICGGHLLIEDVPGVGKTILAKALARSVHGSFQRVQFTPDLLPSDVTGVSIYNQADSRFEFQPGPVFANILLVDEINRTTPRTQASLLEAMEERQVTVDNITHPLPKPFFVIATQNPVEYHGTYPLPEGQKDRFLIAVGLGYPSMAVEREIVEAQMFEHPIESVDPVLTVEEALRLQEVVKRIHIEPELIDYAISLVHATREHPALLLGASPRGTLALVRSAQASALLDGRDYVIPDDIKRIAVSVLPHRLVTQERSRGSLMAATDIVDELLEQVPVPMEPTGSGR